jgi:hypothetical protein
MSEEQELKLLIPSHDVINSFCYAYSKALLKKLKELVKEDRIFVAGNAESVRNKGMNTSTTDIANAVLTPLQEQINFSGGGYNQAKVDKLIATAEEFLAIFEAKQPPAGA